MREPTKQDAALIQAALWEIGYLRAQVTIELAGHGYGEGSRHHLVLYGVPVTSAGVAAAWQATELANCPHPCWSCWNRPTTCAEDDSLHYDCAEGHCHFPDEPKTPPRELLTVAGP